MINIDSLKSQGGIRLHGNGFIQLPVEGNEKRLHIWPFPRLKTQDTPTPIHNHVFGFTSKVLLGRIFNIGYHVFHHEKGNYGIYEAVRTKNEDTILGLIKEQPYVNLKTKSVEMFETGDAYTVCPLDYHESVSPELSVTFIEKTIQLSNFNSRVLCPIDLRPDNDYSRYQISEKILWEIVDDALQKIYE